MSKDDSIVIRTISIIAASVIGALIIGLFGFYSMAIRFDERIEGRVTKVEEVHEMDIESVKAMHNKDIQYILKDIKEIKLNQRDFKSGQDEVLEILRSYSKTN